MAKKFRTVLREAKRAGLSAAEAWAIIRDNTLATAKRDKWKKSETAAALADHFQELKLAYGVTEAEKVRAAEMAAPAAERFPRFKALVRALKGRKRDRRHSVEP